MVPRFWGIVFFTVREHIYGLRKVNEFNRITNFEWIIVIQGHKECTSIDSHL